MKKKDYYKDYNHEDYIHYREVKVDGYQSQKVKTDKGKKIRMNPKTEKRIIPFEEIQSLNLDSIGVLHPQLDTEDYFIVGNYLMDFWGAVMGSDAVMAYLHLLRHAYGKKDYCFPSLDLISAKMNISKNTLKKNLRILEEHHFIVQFNRYNASDNNNQESPLFKIRRYIPMITNEMYNNLNPRLQELHDRFIAQYEGLDLNNELNEKQAVINEMVIDKKVMANKKARELAQTYIEEIGKYEYLLDRISETDREATNRYCEVLKNHVAKPSYDTWFKNLIFIDDIDKQIIVAHNDFAKEWIEIKYIESIKEWLNINKEILVILIDDYIKDMEK